MKTILPSIRLLLIVLLIKLSLFGGKVFAQPDYRFTVPTLQSGTARQVNAVYRYAAVKPGVDALVTIKAIVNATIDSIDRSAVGHLDAFQPSFNVNAASIGYGEFEFRFVTAGTSTLVNQDTLYVSSIDVDGSGPAYDPTYTIYEMDQYQFPGSFLVDYDMLGTNLSIVTSGGWTVGKNMTGAEFADIDTIAKVVMFTMRSLNLSSFTVRMGADNQNTTASYRLRSLYFKKFNYPAILLPVKLSDFVATLNNGEVNLDWTTEEEINTSHFMIERSIDGTEFNESGIVFAKGGAAGQNKYVFTDNINNAGANTLYYRLRSVDNDGKYNLSEIRIIRIEKKAEQVLTIKAYPNPVSNELRITIPATWLGKKVTYEVVGNNGQVSKRVIAGSANQTGTINVNNLAPGFYVIKAACNGEMAMQKIIKR